MYEIGTTRFIDSQIVAILLGGESEIAVIEISRKHGISQQTEQAREIRTAGEARCQLCFLGKQCWSGKEKS